MRGARQTALGIAWIVLQPVMSTVVFSVLFGVLLNVPYPVFALAALVPWIYFPRLIIPLNGVIAGLVDFGVSFGVLVVLMALYRIPLTPRALLLPAFLLLAMLTALGFG